MPLPHCLVGLPHHRATPCLNVGECLCSLLGCCSDRQEVKELVFQHLGIEVEGLRDELECIRFQRRTGTVILVATKIKQKEAVEQTPAWKFSSNHFQGKHYPILHSGKASVEDRVADPVIMTQGDDVLVAQPEAPWLAEELQHALRVAQAPAMAVNEQMVYSRLKV